MSLFGCSSDDLALFSCCVFATCLAHCFLAFLALMIALDRSTDPLPFFWCLLIHICSMSKPGKRISYSNWFITINTNQRFDSYDKARPLLLSLQKAVRSVFQHLEEYVTFASDMVGHTWSDDYILQVRAKQGVEYSETRGLAHVHFMIAIKHRSKIRLDYSKIQTHIRQSLATDCPQCFRDAATGEPKQLYFNSKLYRNADANFQSYIDKDASVRRDNLV